MNVDWYQVASALLAVLCAVLGWLNATLWRSVQGLVKEIGLINEKLSKELGALEVRIQREFVSYPNLERLLSASLEPVTSALKEIKEILHQKVDKE